MTLQEKILEALSALDVADNEHWTNDGMPRVDVVAKLIDEPALTRAAITAAAPTFTRQKPTQELADTKKDDEEAPPADPAKEEDNVEDEKSLPKTSPLPSGDELDEAEQELKAAQAELADFQAQMSELQLKAHKAQERVDLLLEERAKKDSPYENQKDIMAYLEGQAKLRADRAEALGYVQRSRLDQSMSFKRAFGATRPKFGG